MARAETLPTLRDQGGKKPEGKGWPGVGPCCSRASKSFFLALQIPFEKNCGEDKKCEADLKLSFSPARSRSLHNLPHPPLGSTVAPKAAPVPWTPHCVSTGRQLPSLVLSLLL